MHIEVFWVYEELLDDEVSEMNSNVPDPKPQKLGCTCRTANLKHES